MAKIISGPSQAGLPAVKKEGGIKPISKEMFNLPNLHPETGEIPFIPEFAFPMEELGEIKRLSLEETIARSKDPL